MPVKITTDESTRDININISGVGSKIGFCSILVHAKFSNPISIDRLLSPFLNQMIASLSDDLAMSGFDVRAQATSWIDAYDIDAIKSEIITYNSNQSSEDLNDLLSRALFPADLS